MRTSSTFNPSSFFAMAARLSPALPAEAVAGATTGFEAMPVCATAAPENSATARTRERLRDLLGMALGTRGLDTRIRPPGGGEVRGPSGARESIREGLRDHRPRRAQPRG